MRSAKQLYTAALLLIGLALAGCRGEQADNKVAAPAPNVRVAAVQTAAAIVRLETVGTAVWRQETALGFTTGGQIARILVNEGDRVRRGQLLAVLDTTPLQADLRAADAEARRARAEAERLETLYRDGWVTKPRIEAAQSLAKAAAAQVEAKGFALRTARVIAPSDGVVLARLAEPLQIVAAGSPVVVVGEASGGYVMRVPVNDRIAASLNIGAPAEITFEALGPQPLAGRIVEIGGKARQTTGTFDLEIALPPVPGLRSGMIGRASLTSTREGAAARVVIPAMALQSPRAGEGLVYVIDQNNRAHLRTVQIGNPTDEGVEILGGLNAGETIALSGFDEIRDGGAVNPVKRNR